MWRCAGCGKLLIFGFPIKIGKKIIYDGKTISRPYHWRCFIKHFYESQVITLREQEYTVLYEETQTEPKNT
jgi:hypothetical protein